MLASASQCKFLNIIKTKCKYTGTIEMLKTANIQVKTIQNLSVDKEILFDDLFQLILLFCTKTSQNSPIHLPPSH